VLLEQLVPDRRRGQHDLERVALGRGIEHVVRLLRVAEREAVRRERRGIEAAALDQPQELRRGGRVDETRRDQHVADPQLLEVERRGMAVHADIGQAAGRPDQLGAELEGLRHADSLDRHVGAEAIRQVHHLRHRVVAAVVDRHVGAELQRLLESRRVEVDGDDPSGRVELGGHDRREPDGAGADHGDRVTGLDPAGEHADLVGRGEDVGEEEHLLVREPVRHLVDGCVGERDAGVLRLQAVDQVAEDPAPAAGAEAVPALLAEAAATARRDARDEDPVAGLDVRDGRADLDDRPDRLVAEDRPRHDLGHVSLEDVEISATDRRRVDADDGVGRLDDRRVRHGLPGPLARPAVDERFHDASFRVASRGASRRHVAPASEEARRRPAGIRG
jgi:hypothetical protein